MRSSIAAGLVPRKGLCLLAAMTTRSYSPEPTPESGSPSGAVGSPASYVWAVLRIMFGATFLWAFFDKTLGLGFDTAAENAWLNGGSPTSGFLEFETRGPLAEFYQSLAGNALIDWLFMVGLLGIGVALLTGIGVRVAAVTGAILLVLMWTAYLPPDHHPLLDDHLVYAVVLAGIGIADAGETWGFGKWWSRSPLAQRFPFLI